MLLSQSFRIRHKKRDIIFMTSLYKNWQPVTGAPACSTISLAGRTLRGLTRRGTVVGRYPGLTTCPGSDPIAIGWEETEISRGCPPSSQTRINEKTPRFPKGLDKNWQRLTLPHVTAVPSALRGLTSLFGMERGGHPRYNHHKALTDRYSISLISLTCW